MQDFRTAVREAVRDEAALRGALAEADIAPMLMVLVQLTGDLDFLDEVAPHIHAGFTHEIVPVDQSPPEGRVLARKRVIV